MQTLILSRSDLSTVGVTERLAELGVEPVVLDTDRFPRDLRLILGTDGVLEIREGAHTTRLDRLRSIWYRRTRFVPDLPPDASSALKAGVADELRAFLLGALGRHETLVTDPKWRLDHAGRKPRQLSLAAACGLDVPATLCSSDADAVRAWAAALGRPVVTKVLTSFAIRASGDPQVVFTTPLSPQDLAELDGLELCPGTFQERLDAAVEYRVTVVGRQLFTAALEQGPEAGEGVDWRREAKALARHWRRDTLPEPAAEGLLRLMDRLGLSYGAADFIRTRDGRVVFLELNPAGEYLWLDPLHEGAVSVAIAELLAGWPPPRA
ncbi:MAG: MvdD family ATP-grasp ribosomal peptide maturase [Alphaproteobacteria bacterium]|nr:MvdD family ATP-grasp ribosomal peptide maturase [Alphaproteobacteria bacterium]